MLLWLSFFAQVIGSLLPTNVVKWFEGERKLVVRIKYALRNHGEGNFKVIEKDEYFYRIVLGGAVRIIFRWTRKEHVTRELCF